MMTTAGPRSLLATTLVLWSAACQRSQAYLATPLTPAELGQAVEALKARGLMGPGRVLLHLGVGELSKGAEQAELIVEAQVYDLASGVIDRVVFDRARIAVQSVTRRADAAPPLLSADQRRGSQLLNGKPAWIAALARRGLGPGQVIPVLTGPGVLGLPWEQPGRRYGRFFAVLNQPDTLVTPPVEGVVAIVDFTSDSVVEVLDAEPTPPPILSTKVPLYPRPESGPRPTAVRRTYQLTGNTVTWAGWSFQIEFDDREGVVLRTVGFGHGNRPRRSVLSRASLSEMLVPYGDPSEAWVYRSVFDVGEFGMGRTAATLIPGADVPEGADLFDAPIATSLGEVRRRSSVFGLYERDGGLRWRHRERGARATELVLRSAATLGNYDYGFSWVFSQDGVIAMEIDLTGELLVKGTASSSSPFGTPVSKDLLGIHHQHFFNFRLDFDVAGPRNRLREVAAASVPLDSTNRHGTAFGAASQILATEKAAVRDLDPGQARLWIVENDELRDSLGGAPGYAIVPGPLPTIHAHESAILRRRGAFAKHALWATAWRPDERYAAGDFPGQSKTGEGLPRFVEDNESIRDQDLVVWYTTGITHFPRPEEWPMMPVSRIRFELKPVNFLTPPANGARP